MTKKRKTTSSKRSRKKQAKFTPGAILLLLLIVGILFLGSWFKWFQVDWEAVLEGDFEHAILKPPVVVEPVSGEWYQLYFTSPQYPDDERTRVYTLIDGLVAAINNAQRTIDIAIYEFDLDQIADALIAARNRGVQVRLVTDSDELDQLDTLIRLKKERFPIVPDERGAIMHNKFAVIDGAAVWTGSWNFTPNDTFRNNNNAILIQSPELAKNYTTEFEEMFLRHEFGPTSPANTPYPKIQLGDTLIETCFAPEDDCSDRLVELVQGAQHSITFMAFSFTDVAIGQAVSERGRAGVAVRGIFETRGSETEFSEFAQMKRQNLDVRQDGNPYTLHHKVFIIDNQVVTLGSFNFSDNANRANDENMLIIHNPDIAAEFLAEFDRNYTLAQNAIQ
ncbi:MAG TPA: phospholipase D-like domain-containing protein [Anaerolineae bacterium]|nr:phospholipase D-like domain-containing protein [Anaerolineae bacterium]